MNRHELAELVAEAFDHDALSQAIIEKIADMIDYSEIADNIVNDHASTIIDLISEIADYA